MCADGARAHLSNRESATNFSSIDRLFFKAESTRSTNLFRGQRFHPQPKDRIVNGLKGIVLDTITYTRLKSDPILLVSPFQPQPCGIVISVGGIGSLLLIRAPISDAIGGEKKKEEEGDELSHDHDQVLLAGKYRSVVAFANTTTNN